MNGISESGSMFQRVHLVPTEAVLVFGIRVVDRQLVRYEHSTRCLIKNALIALVVTSTLVPRNNGDLAVLAIPPKISSLVGEIVLFRRRADLSNKNAKDGD